jgi:hypothetical protein
MAKTDLYICRNLVWQDMARQEQDFADQECSFPRKQGSFLFDKFRKCLDSHVSEFSE